MQNQANADLPRKWLLKWCMHVHLHVSHVHICMCMCVLRVTGNCCGCECRVDCIGILKLRNADVEQRIGLAKSKKKSTSARLIFRVNIPLSDNVLQTLQVSSTPIICSKFCVHVMSCM